MDQEMLSSYLDGELDAEGRRAVEEALETRPELRRVFDALVSVRSSMASLPRRSLDSGFSRQVLEACESSRPAWRATPPRPLADNGEPAGAAPLAPTRPTSASVARKPWIVAALALAPVVAAALWFGRGWLIPGQPDQAGPPLAGNPPVGQGDAAQPPAAAGNPQEQMLYVVCEVGSADEAEAAFIELLHQQNIDLADAAEPVSPGPEPRQQVVFMVSATRGQIAALIARLNQKRELFLAVNQYQADPYGRRLDGEQLAGGSASSDFDQAANRPGGPVQQRSSGSRRRPPSPDSGPAGIARRFQLQPGEPISAPASGDDVLTAVFMLTVPPSR